MMIARSNGTGQTGEWSLEMKRQNKMGNMFQNTSKDLDDCREAIEKLADREAEPLSREELAAAKRLVRACIDIVSLIAEEGDFEIENLLDDERMADEILDALNRDALLIKWASGK